MPGVGGSVKSIGLKARNFSVPADADFGRMQGGTENEVQANGDGSARLIKMVKPWKVSGVQVSVDDSLGDAELLKELRALGDWFPVTITYASGITYTGQGQITGEYNLSSQTQIASFELSGPGDLAQ